MKIVVAFLLMVAANTSVFAQVDISGEWDHPGMFGHEDINDRGQGPEVGDFLGLPLNEAGLRKAESYSGSWLSVPEHQCTPHPAAYQTWGPNTLIANKVYDRVKRVMIAYRLDGTFGLDRIVWMDGRSHPSEDALHTFNGYSTGYWDGDTLVVETTHLKLGWLRRNGTPTSEKARMTEYYQRFDDYLLVTTIVDDPVYFSEPFIRTTEYELNLRPIPIIGFPFTRNDGPTFHKCFPAEETAADKYYVPHFLPGENFLLDEFSIKYGVPRWAMAAGGASMYPEFSDLLIQGEEQDDLIRSAESLDSEQSELGLRSMHVKGKVWAILGGGANITVQVGDEGVLIVDSGAAGMTELIREEIRKIAGDKPIRYVINTNWHEDHTSGNVSLSAESTQRAAILTHENAGLRLVLSGAEAGALIMDTFYSDKKVIYFNGEAIEIIHVPNAHTDGDSLVFFRGSDVVSAGGVISTKKFPVFQSDEEGSVNGLINALNRILDITVAETRGQGGTIVIPGHGRLYDEADVAEYRDMLNIIRDRADSAIESGLSLEDFRESRPVLEYAGVFDAISGDWDTERFTESVYRSLSGE